MNDEIHLTPQAEEALRNLVKNCASDLSALFGGMTVPVAEKCHTGGIVRMRKPYRLIEMQNGEHVIPNHR